MKKDIASLYCLIDDFVKDQEENMSKHQITNSKSKSSITRVPGLVSSEIITILLITTVSF